MVTFDELTDCFLNGGRGGNQRIHFREFEQLLNVGAGRGHDNTDALIAAVDEVAYESSESR